VIFGNILIRLKYGKIMFTNYKNLFIILILSIFSGLITYFLYNNVIEIYLSGDNAILNIMKLLIAFIFYFGLFFFLIGIFSQISIEELTFFENSFKNFPIVNNIISLIIRVEIKIISIRKNK
ncbi:MAG: hypothetical protein ACFFAO_12065, partial [Candidatus Hermodarchaeota archaeon]